MTKKIINLTSCLQPLRLSATNSSHRILADLAPSKLQTDSFLSFLKVSFLKGFNTFYNFSKVEFLGFKTSCILRPNDTLIRNHALESVIFNLSNPETPISKDIRR